MEQAMARRKAIIAFTLLSASCVKPVRSNDAASTESTSCTGEAVATAVEDAPSAEGATERVGERVLYDERVPEKEELAMPV